MIIRAQPIRSGLGDALDDIINGTDGGDGGSTDSSPSWWDRINQTANTQASHDIITGIFSLFGGKTAPRTTGTGTGLHTSTGFPWGYAIAGAGALGLGYLLLRKR